jgi:hypothetical protein
MARPTPKLLVSRIKVRDFGTQLAEKNIEAEEGHRPDRTIKEADERISNWNLSLYPPRMWIERRSSTRRRWVSDWTLSIAPQSARRRWASILLADEADFGLTRAEVNDSSKELSRLCAAARTIKGRLVTGRPKRVRGPISFPFYAAHFLIEAKAAGFAPPNDILKNALHNLQTMVGRAHDLLPNSRAIAVSLSCRRLSRIRCMSAESTRVA